MQNIKHDVGILSKVEHNLNKKIIYKRKKNFKKRIKQSTKAINCYLLTSCKVLYQRRTQIFLLNSDKTLEIHNVYMVTDKNAYEKKKLP